MLTLLVAVLVEECFQNFIGQETSLQEAVHAIVSLKVHAAVCSANVVEVLFFNCFVWYVGHVLSDVLLPGEGCHVVEAGKQGPLS